MICENVYCDDILNQIASVQSAINGVFKATPGKTYEILYKRTDIRR